MLNVENLSKSYDRFLAVDQLSFQAHGGDLMAIVGPNGSGKTSTMRCICGIIPLSMGKVEVTGYDIVKNPVEAKTALTFVPSDPYFYEYLTIREHVHFFARLHASARGLGRDHAAQLRDHGEWLIEHLDLGDKMNALPGDLSRGMKQKLMITCGLIHQPKILILDEPFTALDPFAIRKVRQLLIDHAQGGGCVLISSHLLNMVEGWVNKILIMKNGRKIAHGTIAELQALANQEGDGKLEDLFIQITSQEEVGRS